MLVAWHQWFNHNFMKLGDYFLYTKKTKITTWFNNLSPPRHPIATFWRVSTERKQCCSVSAELSFLRCFRFDLNENNISAWLTQNTICCLRLVDTDVTWIILPMSLLHFWTLIVVITLLSMGRSKSSQNSSIIKYLNLCSEDERRSYGFGTTRGWVINDRIFIFGWTIPLSIQNYSDDETQNMLQKKKYIY